MLEWWYQWTCDGCGATEFLSGRNLTRAEAKQEAAEVYGVKSYGHLNYCRTCVANGIDKARRSIFGAIPD